MASEENFILVVEDDSLMRSVLTRALTNAGYSVREAENGLVAKTTFDLVPDRIQMIISDVRMPQFDGLELLKHVRGASNVPFIVMTGFSEILEAKDAYDLGATDFLAKPFRAEALLNIISTTLNPQDVNSEKAKVDGAEYCPIHVNEFISSTRLLSDIYVKLGSSKFVKVAHKGEEIPVERLKTYREKKVEYLYVTLEDFSTYVDFNIRLTSTAVKSSALSAQKKARLLKHTTEILVEKCFLDDIHRDLVAPAKQMIESTLELVSNDQDVLELFAGLESHSDRLYSHSVAVSVYSCMIARLHGWNSASTLFKVAISGLLHDIGKKELDPQLLKKKRIHRTAEETKLFESHTSRGRDLVMELKNLPEDIAIIIHQHHENAEGTGYPLQLKGESVHAIARLIGTVDRFAAHVIPADPAAEHLKPHEAIAKMQLHPNDDDPTFILRLGELFKTPPVLDRSKAVGS